MMPTWGGRGHFSAPFSRLSSFRRRGASDAASAFSALPSLRRTRR